VVANALFADGAGAVVAGGVPRPAGGQWELVATSSALVDDSTDAMTWRIGNHGFQMTISSRVPGLIQRALRPWLDPWLASQDLTVERVASWAVHPGGPRILESCAQVTGCTRAAFAASHEILAEFGNMSSATIVFILERLRRTGAPRPCVALGFGPGLSVEGALFR
jgi:predicted naringenin-chalcone synthase